MKKHKTAGLKPGEKCPVSGQYQVVKPNGTRGTEVTVSKGEHMPPGQWKGVTYELVDRTNHEDAGTRL
jgi:hypothetical protein